jgi:hypothetical protein
LFQTAVFQIPRSSSPRAASFARRSLEPPVLQVPKAVPLRDGEVKSVQAGRMDMEKREHEKNRTI